MIKLTITASDKLWGVFHEQLSEGKLIYLLLTSQRKLHVRPGTIIQASQGRAS